MVNKYIVTLAETSTYEVVVLANSEEEARSKGLSLIADKRHNKNNTAK